MRQCLIARLITKKAPSIFNALAALFFLAADNGLAQKTPVVHWINDLHQEAYTTLSGGTNFITSFKATNDVQISLLSGSLNAVFQEAFAGLGPNNNNPAFVTNFIGLAANETGDGTAGHIQCLQSGSSTMTLRFDFAVPLTSYDRILIVDVDNGEGYGIQAFFGGQPVNLSGWGFANYSGEASILPDSTWPIWSPGNGTNGTLLANTDGGLSEPLSVLTPNQSVDRIILTKFPQGGGSIVFQIMSLPVPIVEPVLQIQRVASNTVVSWPAFFNNYSLYTTTNLTPPITWAPIGVQPSLNSTQLAVTNAPSVRARFYRLQLQ